MGRSYQADIHSRLVAAFNPNHLIRRADILGIPDTENAGLALATGTNLSPTLRDGEGALPVAPVAMSTSSPDALSDTKIFVLLAAIVFIFLIALGVAMTRVSRSRRNRYQEQARQQIVAAQQHPETLNKTILDLLPVFEVTAKRELRLIRSCTPRAGFSNCFTDDAIGCSTQPVPVASSTECSTPTPIQSMTASLDGGYAIESEKSSQDSIPLAYLRFSARQPGRDRPLEPATGALCKATTDDIEMAAWENNCTSNKRFKRPTGRSVRMSPCSIGTPAPVAIRYYRPNTSQATTPQFSSRHSTAGYNWEGSTPGRNPEARMDFGAVVYRERSSQSLDLDHAAGLGGLGDATEHAQKCAATRAPHWSQPDIAHRRSHRLSAASDGGLGACPICLEEFDIGEQLRELPCLHKYHVVCIDTWLVSRSTCCPYCKLDIQRWYYGPSFEEEEQHRQGDVNQPIDFHEVPPVSSYSATTTQGPRHRRDRSGGSRLNRAMRAVHTALSNHGNVAM